MADDREERIRARAHQIWEEQGRPEGRHEDHWRQACAEIEAEAGGAADVSAPSGTEDHAGGIASGLQPGGTIPGPSPATGMGSLGTGGGSTAGAATGNTARTDD